MANSENKKGSAELGARRVALSLHQNDYRTLLALAAISYKNNTKPTSVANQILTDFLTEHAGRIIADKQNLNQQIADILD